MKSKPPSQPPPPPPPSRQPRASQTVKRPSAAMRPPEEEVYDLNLPSGPVPEHEIEQTLREVVEGAARFTRAVELAKPMRSYRSRPIVLGTIAIFALAIALYSVTARPEWVYGPDPAKIAPAQRAAHIRFAMFLTAQRLHAYREAHQGALPQSLSEVGDEWPGIIYRRVDGAVFELRSVDRAAPAITLRNDEDAVAFLGSSRTQLRRQQP